MKPGVKIRISDESGRAYFCTIESISEKDVWAVIDEVDEKGTELPCRVVLFQGLPKGDKMELIIQKAVELGVNEVVPVAMKNCVMKLDEKKKRSRRERWQAIAESAAKQSKRNIIPQVFEVASYKEALEQAKEMDLFLLPYENERGMAATREALERIQSGTSVAILIGPEGGFEPKEVTQAQEAGAVAISLGSRILRTETAAITTVGMCMLHAEMHLGGDGQ